MIIIKFLLFLFLFFLISGIITVAKIVWRIRRMHREMKKQYGQSNGSTRYKNSKHSSYQQAEGEILTDTRDPQKVNRKIIADDEGEYIDFEEEK